MARLTLLSSVSTNSSGDAVQLTGGVMTFAAWGTWDTATVTLEYSPDGGTTWIAVGSDTTLTADGVANFQLPAGTYIRATVSSVGGSTSVSAQAYQ